MQLSTVVPTDLINCSFLQAARWKQTADVQTLIEFEFVTVKTRNIYF